MLGIMSPRPQRTRHHLIKRPYILVTSGWSTKIYIDIVYRITKHTLTHVRRVKHLHLRIRDPSPDYIYIPCNLTKIVIA